MMMGKAEGCGAEVPMGAQAKPVRTATFPFLAAEPVVRASCVAVWAGVRLVGVLGSPAMLRWFPVFPVAHIWV